MPRNSSSAGSITRRGFVGSVAAGLGTLALGRSLPAAEKPAATRPNILWIVSEDNNPYLGCYGNKLVRTPTLDGLAREGVLYENCFSQAPVCAPSRFTLITGMYATSCGPAEHMRAQGKVPSVVRGFPAYLREAGYYCTNSAKTDYNGPINIKDAWDESSGSAHWRNRPAGKPFFAVFNHGVTHESSMFSKGGRPPGGTDPAKVVLPAYHPDTPEFRQDRAHYYDQMALLDGQVAKLLKALEDDGLAEDTIVFYYGDNGGVLGRSKRFCFDSGLHVPLIIRFPKKFQHLATGAPGSRIEAPVSFVDFSATVLSLAGVPAPKYMEGHAFAGPAAAGPQEYAFSFRNRMDERYDFVRTVRDKRYRYIRNYMPHVIYGQHVSYMFQQRSVQVWQQMYREGKLVGPQKFFWEEKPEEELYDLATDPDEVKNLAAGPQHQEILRRMRAANEQHILRLRDNGFIPEGSPLEGYDTAHDPKAYPLEKILEVANTATRRDPANLPKLTAWMEDENECLRYWAALGCVMLRDKAAGAADALVKRLADSSGQVRVAAAEALCWAGQEAKGLPVLEECLSKNENAWVRLQAANALQNIGEKARPALPALEQALASQKNYVLRAVEYTVAELKGAPAANKKRKA
ncbi:MAG: sulfatase-like hydrolase/transferase [Planctomycetes bacterium]|nr:sulfatase-like hydrolase/transferase [Planctomycetota bacterium]